MELQSRNQKGPLACVLLEEFAKLSSSGKASPRHLLLGKMWTHSWIAIQLFSLRTSCSSRGGGEMSCGAAHIQGKGVLAGTLMTRQQLHSCDHTRQAHGSEGKKINEILRNRNN